MSNIIRLQNLPLSAEPEDIRKFFGGGRLPRMRSRTPRSPPRRLSRQSRRSRSPGTRRRTVEIDTEDLGNYPTSSNMLVVTLSNLKLGWDSSIVIKMLKGTFVTKKNVVFKNDQNSKTRTAYVKFYNESDIKSILLHSSYYYKKRLIQVCECPESVYIKHFPYEERQSLYYIKMEGLPYDVTTEQVLSFFGRLHISDLYIVYAKCRKGHKLKGIAFVAFGTKQDYKKSFLKNGELFLNTNRTIHFMQSNINEMHIYKEKNCDLLYQSRSFVPATYVEVPEISPINSSLSHFPRIPSGRRDYYKYENDSKESLSFSSTHSESRSFYRPFMNEDMEIFKAKDIIANLDNRIQQTFYKSEKIENSLETLKKRMQMEEAVHEEARLKIERPKVFHSDKHSRWSSTEPPALSSKQSVDRSVRSLGSEMSFETFVFLAENCGNTRNKFQDPRTEEQRWSPPPRSVPRIFSLNTFNHGNYSNSDPYSYDEMPSKYREAVVQICNVDIDVSVPELEHFFVGFDIDANQIDRRITFIGEPTGDVRVTFKRHTDAVLAIRKLRGKTLRNVPIDMFLVEQDIDLQFKKMKRLFLKDEALVD